MSTVRPPLPGGPYLVAGLARSGAAAALALARRGEAVIGVDSTELQGLDELRAAGIEVRTGVDGRAEVARARTLVKSPGVASSAPVVSAARAAGLPVLGELELAWRLLANPFIAVTGTNGKTTTVELLGHIYREAGLAVVVAGNIGVALSGLVDELADDAVVVCEASSFQLEDTLEFAPDTAVLLNLGADHLDRHGSLANYVKAKLEIFRRQGNYDVAVAPDDSGLEDLGGCARRVLFGSGPEADLADRAGQLWWGDEPLLAAHELGMRGEHNRRNAMAAAAAALSRGIDPEVVRTSLRTFRGVAHRLEQVAERGGVLFVNDSKATNVDSTIVGLRSFPAHRVHLILGGQGKGQEFGALRPVVAEHCVASYLIGADAPAIAAALDGLPIECCGELERAVALATERARRGEVVLLSPACASFDQFKDFEQRGARFRELVQA